MNMNQITQSADIIFMTLDTLRYDVAQQLWEAGELPNFSKWLPATGWEKRHSPGSFTYAAHHAFFAGFLPTPVAAGVHPRLFATQFAGSTSVNESTLVVAQDNIVEGLSAVGYRTVCIGGVGFFNQKTALSKVFPNLFEESYWEEAYGVAAIDSTQNQMRKAVKILQEQEQKIFLFINISALHQPNYFYLNKNEKTDTLASHAAALKYVDSQLPILQKALKKRKNNTLIIACGDHGTTYGEDGYFGHRIGHPKVWNVPYLECLLE